MHLGLGLIGRGGGAAGFTPGSLGADLLDMWDAEDASKFTLSGSSVNAWASSKNGYSAAQSVGASKPTYSATSFNGRPGVTFDGSDDELTYPGVGVLPTGSTACEIWALISQNSLVADTGAKIIFGYGGATSPTRRAIDRNVTFSVNRARNTIGNGTTTRGSVNSSVDFSGIHVVRAVINATARTDVDGVAGPDDVGTTATGTDRVRIGAISNATASNFFLGVANFFAVTNPLSATQAASMLAYLKARGGIP